MVANEFQRILGLLERLGLPTSHPMLEATNASGASLLLEGLEEFRQHLGGRLTVTLLEGLGEGFETHQIDPARVKSAIDFLNKNLAAA